jgi:hypothetical protein
VEIDFAKDIEWTIKGIRLKPSEQEKGIFVD